MFKLSCGRVNLYQWDSDVRLTVNDATVSEVHFKNRYSDDVYTVEVIRTDSETYANIPNILLQKSYDIIVYMFCRDDAGNYTKIAETLEVVARPKPADYVYTETELKNYHALEKRIEALEKGGAGGGGGISQETDPTVPAWAKEPNKPNYSADEIGAVSKEEFNTLSGNVSKLSEDKADKENTYTKAEVDEKIQNVPSGEGTSVDVQIDGTSIVEDGVANIPIAGYKDGKINYQGLINIPQGYGLGFQYNTNNLILNNPNPSDNSPGYLEKRKTAWQSQYHAILVKNLDLAVKLAMCDGQGAEWTEEEKASARERMGLGWKYIDTVEVADVTLMEITFPQEYDEFMIIGDVEGSGTSIIYPRATYFYNNGASQQANLSFSDFYPSDKKEHFELVFEKISLENDTLFRMSGFEKTDFVSQKMKQNVQSTGWVRKFDSTNTYQCHRWYGVEINRTITNAKFEVYAR